MIMSRRQQQQQRKSQPETVFSEEILQSFAVLNSGGIGVSMMASSQKEIGSMPSCSYVNSNVLPDQKISRSGKSYTATPYSDGYQWRKYGEKKISGSSFPRSYYRCTYREDKGCQASKQVQQQRHGDPPLFLVTFKGEHTCSNTAASIDDPHPHLCMLQSYQLKRESSISRDHDHRHNYNCPTYSSIDCVPRASHATAHGDMVMVDSPPDPESPLFDFDFLYFNRPDQGLIISNGRSCSKDNASSSEPPQVAMNSDLMEADFAALCDGFFHGSQEFSSIDYEVMVTEPLAYEFDELETLFQILY